MTVGPSSSQFGVLGGAAPNAKAISYVEGAAAMGTRERASSEDAQATPWGVAGIPWW